MPGFDKPADKPAAQAVGEAPQQGAPVWGTPAPPPQASAPPAEYLAPTTYSPSPQGPQPGRKKAVLVGVSYAATHDARRDAANDVQCIRYCLNSRFGFEPSGIVALTDEPEQAPDFQPTKANIFRAMQWLMTDLQFGDSLFFHFSGHGSQLRDPTGAPVGEGMLPVDHATAGPISGAEMHRALCAPLPHGVTLHAVFDSCPSGAVLGLPFQVKHDESQATCWDQVGAHGTSGGHAFQFGVCREAQPAAGGPAVPYTGGATYSFIDSIEKYGVDQTYANMLRHMTESMRGQGKPSEPRPSWTATLACSTPADIHKIQLMI